MFQFFKRKPITPEAAKEAILSLSEPRRMAVISELVKVASRGRATIHFKPGVSGDTLVGKSHTANLLRVSK